MSSSILGRGLTLALFLALPLVAQPLAGNYTIDSSLPAGGGNYVSFVAAAADLVALGVSGPVVFSVANGTGAYGGFAIGAAITGASSTNQIIFVAAPGNTPIVSVPAGANLQTIKFGTANTANSGPSWITLSGLTVEGAPSGAAILCAGCTNMTIDRCIARNSGMGIAFAQTQNSTIQDCEVYGTGQIPGAPGVATYAGGIGLADRSDFCTIQRNRIHDCTGNGFFMGGGGSATAQVRNNIVINNFIWNCPGGGTYPGGIGLRRVTDSVISNNSVLMPVGSANAGLYISAAVLTVTPPVGPAAEVSNNVVRHLGTGACVMFDVTTAVVPTVFDYNLYDVAGTGPVGRVGTTAYATLAAWQALAAPSLAGKEANTLAASAGYLGSTDLHITPASPAFNSGSTVAAVTLDIDQETRPNGGLPDRGADESPAFGLFAAFSATPVSGAPPLAVNFTDSSFSSAGGVTSWAWDFDNNGTIDSTVANPSHVYACPGSYTVALTVTDGVNSPSTIVRNNYITVAGFVFDIATTGGGVADLVITPVPTTCGQAFGAASGYTLVSLATTLPVGAGPAFGLVPDAATFTFLFNPAAPGNPIHFNVAPPLYPDGGSLGLPAGTFASLAGLSMDAVMVFISPVGGLVYVSNVDRVTF